MVKIRDLSYAFDRDNWVLENLDLTIIPGKIYGLVGKNGAGKTTLLHLIAGFKKPSVGSCLVNELDSFERTPKTLQTVYWVSEEPIDSSLRVKEYLHFYSPFYPLFNHALFEKNLKVFELNPNAKINQLSLGQKKKVQICFALSTGAHLLLLDEPTNGLDIPSKTLLKKIIAYSLEEHQSIIISTHQVKDIDNLIDSIIFLEKKKIFINSTLEQITNQFYFGQDSILPPNCLYSERTISGYSYLKKNTEDEYSPINLELFFNATLENPIISKFLSTNSK